MLGEKFPRIRGIFEHGLFEVSRDIEAEYYRKEIRFWYEAGFDYISVRPFLPFLFSSALANDTAVNTRGERKWQNNEKGGLITTLEDFEKYPWPSADDVDYWNLEFVSKNLPDGMKIIATTYGVLETVMWLMGFEAMAFSIYDEPELIERMFNKVGNFFMKVYKNITQMDNVGAVWMGDDMGYKTATLIAPNQLRKLVFPWTKKVAEIAHAAGKPFLFHCCGYRESIMEDLINEVKIDAIHSFEDVIMPVTEAKKRYGENVTILGGVDMDVLGRYPIHEAEIYIDNVITKCAPGGGFAIGSGNSAANYLIIENYKLMLKKGRLYRY